MTLREGEGLGDVVTVSIEEDIDIDIVFQNLLSSTKRSASDSSLLEIEQHEIELEGVPDSTRKVVVPSEYLSLQEIRCRAQK